MKILYAVQGTGNGHISRSREIVPILKKYANVDVLVSGIQSEVNVPFPIRYKKYGLSYIFGLQGEVDYPKTFKSLKPFKLLSDILSVPIHNYNLIINDFEPITAWACKLKDKPCLGLSHQSAFLSPNTPRPNFNNSFSEGLFKNYAPITDKISFHFKSYDNFIHTPVIRQEVRHLIPTNNGHFTVYLPAYGDEILIQELSKIKDVKWEVFSKHAPYPYRNGNIIINPINNEKYLKSLASSQGLLTNGGFESPAEAMFLGKKVMVIPMTNQYEQQCNAIALVDIGGTMAKKMDEDFNSILKNWVFNIKPVKIDFKDETETIIQQIITKYEK